MREVAHFWSTATEDCDCKGYIIEHSGPQQSPKLTSQALQDFTGLLAATYDRITRRQIGMVRCQCCHEFNHHFPDARFYLPSIQLRSAQTRPFHIILLCGVIAGEKGLV